MYNPVWKWIRRGISVLKVQLWVVCFGVLEFVKPTSLLDKPVDSFYILTEYFFTAPVMAELKSIFFSILWPKRHQKTLVPWHTTFFFIGINPLELWKTELWSCSDVKWWLEDYEFNEARKSASKKVAAEIPNNVKKENWKDFFRKLSHKLFIKDTLI